MRIGRIVEKHRKARQDVKAFADYYGGSAAAFDLPANAILAVRPASTATSEGACMTAGSNTLFAPDLEEGQVHELGWFEKGVNVQVLGGFDLLLFTGLDWEQIGAI